VPGTRWVDLETDRGKPARLSSAYAAAAASASSVKQQQQAAEGSEDGLQQQRLQQQQQQQQRQQPVRPLDSVSEPDHLADLEEYPLGSLTSFSSWDDVHENVPEWIETFSPDMLQGSAPGSSIGSGGGAASMRLTGADSSIVGGNYLSHEQMHAIEAVLVEGSEVYKPFCNSMLQQLQLSSPPANSSSQQQQPLPQLSPAAATSVVTVGSSKASARSSADGLHLSWEVGQQQQPDAAEQQQLADWAAADQKSWARSTGLAGRSAAAQAGIGPGSTQSFCDVMAEKAGQQQAAGAAAGSSSSRGVQQQPPQEEQWGQQHKRRTMQKLLDLEDSVLARDGEKEEYKPFCESMFQSL